MDWISVENRLPEEGQRVLFFVLERNEIFCGYFIESDHRRTQKEKVFVDALEHWCFEDETITHWMPVPNQPERSKREDFELLADQFLQSDFSERGGNWETENGYILGIEKFSKWLNQRSGALNSMET